MLDLALVARYTRSLLCSHTDLWQVSLKRSHMTSEFSITSGVNHEDAAATRYFENTIEPRLRDVRAESASVEDNVRTGTQAHKISATQMLSLRAAVKEPLDNVIGIAQKKEENYDLHVFMEVFPKVLPDSADQLQQDGMSQVGKQNVVFLSDTRESNPVDRNKNSFSSCV